MMSSNTQGISGELENLTDDFLDFEDDWSFVDESTITLPTENKKNEQLLHPLNSLVLDEDYKQEKKILDNSQTEREDEFQDILPTVPPRNNSIPFKNRNIDCLHFFEKSGEKKSTVPRTYHEVDRVKKLTAGYDKLYFFKHNGPGSLMSVLESFCCEAYRLIAPNQVSSARAIYTIRNGKREYVGVASKEIKNFKSTKKEDDPLRDEDLIIEAIDKKYMTVIEMDQLNNELGQNYPLKSLEEDNKPLFEKMVLIDNVETKIFITPKDLINYRIKKGLSIGMTTSKIFEEDDYHVGNGDKWGRRFDFDMSLWPLLSHYKESGVAEYLFRYTNLSSFGATAEDIRHFPNLVFANPFYWPTKKAPIIPESFRSQLAKIFPISQNAYPEEANRVFQKLEKDSVFIYHKFATLLKFILTNSALYRELAKLHIDNAEHAEVIHLLTGHLEKIISEYTHVLIAMPEFQNFMQEQGKYALNNILSEFKQHNARFIGKVAKNPALEKDLKGLQIDINLIQEKFAVIEQATQHASIQSLSMTQFV